MGNAQSRTRTNCVGMTFLSNDAFIINRSDERNDFLSLNNLSSRNTYTWISLVHTYARTASLRVVYRPADVFGAVVFNPFGVTEPGYLTYPHAMPGY